MQSEAGFTLVEVMVATFITAILLAMGSLLISDTLQSREALNEVIEDSQELELARLVLRQDMAQLVERRPRGAYGEPAYSAFLGGYAAPDNALLAFVRTGNEFPGLELPRSRLQYVEYRLVEDDLVRASREFVDSVPGTQMHQRVLISGVSNLEIAFLNGTSWDASWARPLSPTQRHSSAPEAVALRFDHARYGAMELRLLTVAAS
ncbi:MAG: type II secretion system minor pseudopilin GspJ [Hyphomonadaceae bacterium]|nr:type II secretion system minor pseudopilin GspJ [Hyphomonadaceae bacterium]